MGLHVDIVRNRPLEGTSKAIASLELAGGKILFTDRAPSDNPDYWRKTLEQVVHINPDEQPKEFLAAVSARLDGTYVFATAPHEEGECPYHEDNPPSAPAAS
jgi:hypothetical protein